MVRFVLAPFASVLSRGKSTHNKANKILHTHCETGATRNIVRLVFVDTT